MKIGYKNFDKDPRDEHKGPIPYNGSCFGCGTNIDLNEASFYDKDSGQPLCPTCADKAVTEFCAHCGLKSKKLDEDGLCDDCVLRTQLNRELNDGSYF